MSGNAMDSSGFSYHGKVVGATLAKDRFNNDSSAYYFDGKNDYIEFINPEKLNVNTDEISVSLWFKPEKGNYYNTLIAHNGFHFIIQLMDNNLEPAFAIQRLTFDYKGAKKKQNRLTLNETMSTSKWSHLVCVFDSSSNNISVYIDGKLNYSGYASGSLRKDNKNWRIGARESSGFPEYFKGYIDEVKVFDCAIDSSDVSNLYNGSKSNDSCTAKITISKDPFENCRYTFSADSSIFSVKSKFYWELGDNKIDTGKTVEHTYIQNGDYTVTLRITDSLANCKTKETALITARKCVDPDTTTNCLVLDMHFNGNAKDSSGNSYHGTVYGATPSKDRFGEDSSAYFFDGKDDYIEIQSIDKLNKVSDRISISAWVKPESGNFYNTIIAHNGAHLIMQLLDKELQPAILIQKLTFGYEKASEKFGRLVTNDTITTHGWTHLVCVYDSSQSKIQLYFNGVLGYEGSAQGSLRNDKKEWWVGARNSPGFEEYFKGHIDDIKIFRCAIDSNKVKNLFFDKVVPPICTADFEYSKIENSNCNIAFNSKSKDTTSFTNYSWELDGENIKNLRTFSHQFSIPGNYSVTLKIRDSTTGCLSEITKILDLKGCRRDFPDTSKCLAVDIGFDKTIKDESENNYLITTSGVLLTDDYLGTDSSAALFTGNDYLDIYNPVKINSTTNQITIAMWINVAKASSYATLISHGGANFLMQLIGNDLQPSFLIQNVTFDYKNANEYQGRLLLKNKLAKNEWYHIACSFDSLKNEIKVYLNGDNIYKGYASGSLRNSDSTWRIGSRKSTTFPEYYNGIIDEVKIFKCVLDSSEIKKMYDLPTTVVSRFNNSIELYPNPSSSAIFISGLSQNHSLKLVNSLGQNIDFKEIKIDKHKVKLELNNPKNGVHFIRIFDLNDNTFITKPLIIKK
ncbi:MAG: LamG-like jellyroll fold domain-containing protein [Bacteroidia bacterium]